MTEMEVDALIIGGGIAGLQAAVDLADQGFQVLVVEKQPSIGGKMIGLSKVFPTLDCCSCIATPRMAEAEHHPNVTIQTYSEVLAVDRNGTTAWALADATGTVRTYASVNGSSVWQVRHPRFEEFV